MARSLSVTRRRPGLVDLNLRVRPGVRAYQFKASTNFNGSFTLFQTVPACGFRSPGAPDVGMTDGQFRGLTRFLFNPSDYTTAVPAVDDTKPFWLSVLPVSTAGVVGPAEASHLVLPFSSVQNRSYNIASTIDTSTYEIQLPFVSTSMSVEVVGSNNVFVAFDPGGVEYKIPSLTGEGLDFHGSYAAFSQLFLRGSNATTQFYLSLRLMNNVLT